MVSIQADLNRVQTLVPPGSLLWLYAHIAKRVIRLSLEALDQPPAARLSVCAKPRPRFMAHLDAATDKALSVASRAIDDLFHAMARESARPAVGGELPGGSPGHRPPPVYLASARRLEAPLCLEAVRPVQPRTNINYVKNPMKHRRGAAFRDLFKNLKGGMSTVGGTGGTKRCKPRMAWV
ncbi:hypothetical protein [Methylomagnum sp.]